jgi:diguanylate cyclase (GGDEF)-like protein
LGADTRGSIMSFLRLPSRLRVGLLGKFAFVSLLPVAVLGLALAHVLREDVRERALTNARQSALLLEESLIQPQLTTADLRHKVSATRVRALDQLLEPSLQSGTIARIKIWAPSGTAVYATDHGIIGKRFAPSDELREALAGETASEVSDLEAAENTGDRSFGRLLEVYTPLRFSEGGPVAGAFELYLPYRPIEATIQHDTRRLSAVLVTGLLLLYLALYRIVGRASKQLRRQTDDLRRQADVNEHLAFHDSLTDLPNRILFHDRAAQAIEGAKRTGECVALMLLDLDRFKEINDTLGHHNGDLLLKQIAERLRAELRGSDSVARLGGDEFGVLLSTVSDSASALSVGKKVRQLLHQPLTLQGITLDLDTSIGVAIYPDHGQDVETLLQRADIAMYIAKEDHSGCELYAAGRDEYSPSRLALVSELRRAIDRQELILYYQPKAQLADGQVSGVEALVRWQHPERGLIPPAEFIPLAERTGLIRDLTWSVLESALRQLREWQDQALELNVSVNLSARDLLDLALPDSVEELLARFELPAERLELEITESVILADPMRARAVLSRLDTMGVQLAIDDFGSGYSSLAYLKRLPVGEIKIDRSFVMNMEHDENDAVIVRSTIDLGRNLGLRVVAEGVESEATWRQLAHLRCDQAQGFFLTPPVPADQLVQWLRQRPATHFGAADVREAASG